MSLPETMKALVNIREGGVFTCGVRDVPTPVVSDPKDLIIKMEACPINPSDLPNLGALAMVSKGPQNVEAGGTPGSLKTALPEEAQGNFADGEPTILGMEGCGIVVATGSFPGAQKLMGKRVSIAGGQAYAQYRKHTIGKLDPYNNMLAPLPDDVSPAEGASVFVNPLTVMGFLHTMQKEGHKAIVHTAAGSQVGRMMVKHCKQMGVPLVNIVRKEEAAAALKALGAEHIVISSADTYKADLLAAIKTTGATVAFDATGGGDLASDILDGMTKYLLERDGAPASPWYGPYAFRQVYRYGGLDRTNTTMPPSLGPGNWGYGGWLMPFHYMKYGEEHLDEALDVIVQGLKGTFSTGYGKHLKLDDIAASPESYFACMASKSEEKFLVIPNGDF